jgi:hypothetical protein
MASKNQATHAPETEISVDMNAADPSKAVTRRGSADIARGVREASDTDRPVHTKAEKDMFRRMTALERRLHREFDQDRANREAEHQRELSALKERLDKLSVDRGGDDAADAAHETAINALKDKLAAAYEKGDSAASADITLQISKLDAQFWAKKAAAAGVVQRETARPEGERPQQQQGAPKTTGPTVAGSRFIRANEDWWEDPVFEAEKAVANTIYQRLVSQEGFDPKSGETFKEVAKQLKVKFPKLAVKSGGTDPDEDDDEDDDRARGEGEDRPTERQPRRQAAAARIDDRGPANARDRGRSTSRTLSAEEIATMKACRLDPDNDAHVVQFLREAVTLEAQS